jgi:hypothetical protein
MLRISSLLAFAALAVGSIAGNALAHSARQPRIATPRLFGPTSIWNKSIARHVRLDPRSRAMSRRLDEYVQEGITEGNGPWINTTTYSTPIYTVRAGQPTVTVNMDYFNPSLDAAMAAVPIPRGAKPASGTDSQITIYQPSSDTLWELFYLRQGISPPPFLSAVVGLGGALVPGRYYYGVTAITATGQTTVSPVHSYDVPLGGKVMLRWNGPVGARSYRIFRGPDPQHLRLVGTLTHKTTKLEDPNCVWTDDGRDMHSAVTPPDANTATTPGQWHAEWGGRILHVSTDPGYYRNIPNPLGGFIEQDTWGSTASSLPIVGGLITLADLASGHINHAVAIMVPRAASRFVFPAQRTDGVDTSRGAIPEGARFRLDPRLDLSKLRMPAVTREIAVAAQRYGMIVDDQTGVTVGFRAQDPAPLMRTGRPNPYVRYFTDPTTGAYMPPNRLLASFPWSHLEVVAPPRHA